MFDKTSLLQRIQELSFPEKDYWVVAGGAMVLHGFRPQTRDIDLGCSTRLADQLEQQGYVVSRFEDGTRKIRYSEDVEIFENWLEGTVEIVSGVPVVSVNGLIQMKTKLGREKDLADIALMEKARKSTGYMKQQDGTYRINAMGVTRVVKQKFTVIGMEGSTNDGDGFIEKLWNEANAHFAEIADLCKRDESGHFAGFWGAMSDFSRSFKPWEDFSKGLYLAGAECRDEAEAPSGWTKWVVPAFEYLRFDCEEFTFGQAIDYVRDNGFSLAGAVHDFTDPRTGKGYIYIPIKKLG